MYIVGIDIGYSNLKFVYGSTGGKAKEVVMPAGAGPARELSGTLVPGADFNSDSTVFVGDEEWVAGVPTERFENAVRELHQDYTSSDAYLALYRSALSHIGRSQIDRVVTGLPVDHYRNDAIRERVQAALAGEHRIRENFKVKVNDVEVMPQPGGAYMNLVSDFDDVEMLQEARVLIIDPGFFSVDWVWMDGASARMRSSGTSLEAMSKTLDAAAEIMSETLGGPVVATDIERALRDGRETIFFGGERVRIKESVEKAAEQTAHIALSSLRASVRSAEGMPDILLLTGGGAHLYRSSAEEIFDKSRIILPAEPVLANARGFHYYGL
jgi:plasmid segregation protein ParM